MPPMIVTIDGPAGAGKSTIARALAARLGFAFLDTGAMYRAVALAGVRHGADFSRPSELAALAELLEVKFDGGRLLLNGEDVSAAIRTPEITAVTRYAAGNEAVRRRLVTLQREAAREREIVTEGRDQGTLVFPRAECKIFLTASPEERARRRHRELAARDPSVLFADVLSAQRRRDEEDAARAFGALKRAEDAIELATDGLSIEEVVARIEEIVRKRAADRTSVAADHPAE